MQCGHERSTAFQINRCNAGQTRLKSSHNQELNSVGCDGTWDPTPRALVPTHHMEAPTPHLQPQMLHLKLCTATTHVLE